MEERVEIVRLLNEDLSKRFLRAVVYPQPGERSAHHEQVARIAGSFLFERIHTRERVLPLPGPVKRLGMQHANRRFRTPDTRKIRERLLAALFVSGQSRQL